MIPDPADPAGTRDPPRPDPLAAGVLLVGPGRLGRSLAQALRARGLWVELAGRERPIPAHPLTWLTVPDAALAEVAAEVPPGGILLHASGASPVDCLRPHRPAGSLHPLMSFPGPERAMPPMEGLPAAVAGDEPALEAARALALRLGWRPVVIQGDRRLYHAAAVLAGNGATTLLAAARDLLIAAGAPRDQALDLLGPLARASLDNALRLGPEAAQTGPAARGDRALLEAEAEAIAATAPALAPLFRELSALSLRLAGHAPARPRALED